MDCAVCRFLYNDLGNNVSVNRFLPRATKVPSALSVRLVVYVNIQQLRRRLQRLGKSAAVQQASRLCPLSHILPAREVRPHRSATGTTTEAQISARQKSASRIPIIPTRCGKPSAIIHHHPTSLQSGPWSGLRVAGRCKFPIIGDTTASGTGSPTTWQHPVFLFRVPSSI